MTTISEPAMYSSCFSAHFAASSVEIAWFCPSASSVTRNVDRFDRASTSVCTFRFPYFVGRAVGIFAASSLTSSALGFSTTRFAGGSRNSIFATSDQLLSSPWPSAILPSCARFTRNEAESGGDCVASETVEAKHDVLVIGAGCAGMRAAIEAFDAGADVALISKIHPVRSHSGAAEGGINAALGNASEDSPEAHAFDTVKGSDYLGDQDAIQILCDEAPGDVYQLENWGAVFSRTEDGRIAQRPFGAAGEPRTAYAADITGHVLIQVLYEQVMKRDLLVYEEYFAWRLVLNDDRCQGVIAWDLLHGGLKSIGAKTVILATGGAGRLYTGTTNAYACTGAGMTMALRVGVALKDMERMQFHPTTLAPTGVLITEGCRGEGAFLLNKDGERFLKRYAPNAMELASRDVISRAEQPEI